MPDFFEVDVEGVALGPDDEVVVFSHWMVVSGLLTQRFLSSNLRELSLIIALCAAVASQPRVVYRWHRWTQIC